MWLLSALLISSSLFHNGLVCCFSGRLCTLGARWRGAATLARRILIWEMHPCSLSLSAVRQPRRSALFDYREDLRWLCDCDRRARRRWRLLVMACAAGSFWLVFRFDRSPSFGCERCTGVFVLCLCLFVVDFVEFRFV